MEQSRSTVLSVLAFLVQVSIDVSQRLPGRLLADFPTASAARSTPFIPPPARRTNPAHSVEEYSDHSDREDVIDIDAVSSLGESAPTSLFRDRTNGREVKGEGKAEKGKARAGPSRHTEGGMDVDSDAGVKAEPRSPVKRRAGNEGLLPPVGWEEDGEGVNQAQAVDLSESESEEEEPDRTSDFVQTEDGASLHKA